MGINARDATKMGLQLERAMRSRFEPRCSFAKSAPSPRLPITTISASASVSAIVSTISPIRSLVATSAMQAVEILIQALCALAVRPSATKTVRTMPAASSPASAYIFSGLA